MKSHDCFRALSAVALSCLAFASLSTMAAGMVPQTPVVIVDEGTGDATLIVKNTDDQPALLYSSIEHIAEDPAPILLLTPPVIRVEAGQSQQVRFVLHSETPLTTERLKRAVFEGIKPRQSAEGAHVSLGVRQNIPVILRPANLPIERAPWKLLVWRVTEGKVQVSNPSPYVVRLSKSVSLLPGGEVLDLGRTYILPGEVLTPAGDAFLGTHVRLFPATTYGFAVSSHDAPLSTQ